MPEVLETSGFAASTPATDGQHLCAVFANDLLVCFDRDGGHLWTKNLGVPDNPYGHASSLVTYRNRVIVQFDQGTEDDDKSSLLALDMGSGKVAWQTQRATAASWATPLVISASGRQELITCAAPWVISYDPDTGGELWRAGCIGGDVVPSPVYAGGLVFTASEGSSLAAIRPGGKGDVTNSQVVWTVEDDLPDVCSPASDGELVFILTTTGFLTCLATADGELIGQKQLEATFHASPSIVGGKLYLISEAGETIMLAAERDLRELGRAALGESVSASPAFAPGRIYIRGEKSLYCIGK